MELQLLCAETLSVLFYYQSSIAISVSVTMDWVVQSLLKLFSWRMNVQKVNWLSFIYSIYIYQWGFADPAILQVFPLKLWRGLHHRCVSTAWDIWKIQKSLCMFFLYIQIIIGQLDVNSVYKYLQTFYLYLTFNFTC